MKKSLTILFQSLIIIVAIIVFIILIKFPQTEGRAIGLDLFHIYTDPFIIYGYIASFSLFIALYNGFKLVTFIDNDNFYSNNAMNALKKIKHAAISFSLFILFGFLYILFFHSKDDDPAGFVIVSFLFIVLCIIVAKIASKYEMKIKDAINK